MTDRSGSMPAARYSATRFRTRCPERAGRLAIGYHLVIGDDDGDVSALFLQPDPVRQRPEVVPQVQRTGRPVAGHDAEARPHIGARVGRLGGQYGACR